MRNNLLFCALLTVATALLSVTVIEARGPRDDIRGADRYDMSAERVFQGAVENGPYMRDGLVHFRLRTSELTIQVQIGPKEFVEGSGIKLNPSELLTVTGVPVVIRGRKTVLAREVRSATAVLIVRDRNGEPMWRPGGPIQMDPEHGSDPHRYANLKSQSGTEDDPRHQRPLAGTPSSRFPLFL
jgi:hypothetical protein